MLPRQCSANHSCTLVSLAPSARAGIPHLVPCAALLLRLLPAMVLIAGFVGQLGSRCVFALTAVVCCTSSCPTYTTQRFRARSCLYNWLLLILCIVAGLCHCCCLLFVSYNTNSPALHCQAAWHSDTQPAAATREVAGALSLDPCLLPGLSPCCSLPCTIYPPSFTSASSLQE